MKRRNNCYSLKHLLNSKMNISSSFQCVCTSKPTSEYQSNDLLPGYQFNFCHNPGINFQLPPHLLSHPLQLLQIQLLQCYFQSVFMYNLSPFIMASVRPKHFVYCVLDFLSMSTSFQSLFSYKNNLREKFSPGPGIEPGSPALRAGAITTKPPRRSAGPS